MSDISKKYQQQRYNLQRRIKRAIAAGYDVPQDLRYIPTYTEMKELGEPEFQIENRAIDFQKIRIVDIDGTKVFQSDYGEYIYKSEDLAKQEQQRQYERYSPDGLSLSDYQQEQMSARERYRAEQHALNVSLFDQVSQLIQSFKWTPKTKHGFLISDPSRREGVYLDWEHDRDIMKKTWEATLEEVKNAKNPYVAEHQLANYISNNLEFLITELSSLSEMYMMGEYKLALSGIISVLKGGHAITDAESEQIAHELEYLEGE